MIETELTTKRLKIRGLLWDDLSQIHALHSLPEINQYNTLGIPRDIETTKAIVREWIMTHQQENIRCYTFVIESLSSKDFIGLIAIKLGNPKFKIAEVWYKLFPDYWGKGMATESLKAVLRFGFHMLHLHRIEAGCAVDNIASARVLEKAGMRKEGSKRKVLPLKGGWSDNYEYAILEEDLA